MTARSSLRIGLLALVLLLAGCQALGGSATPEQAAAKMLLDPASSDAVVDAGSVAALQEQSIGGSTYVVLSYRRMWNKRDQTCLTMYETHPLQFGGWTSRGGGGSCADNDDPVQTNDPMSVMSGTMFGANQDEQDISYILGRVRDETIQKVSVTWKDGQTQHAEVVNGSVLVVREGEMPMKTVIGLNRAGEAVHTAGR